MRSKEEIALAIAQIEAMLATPPPLDMPNVERVRGATAGAVDALKWALGQPSFFAAVVCELEKIARAKRQ